MMNQSRSSRETVRERKIQSSFIQLISRQICALCSLRNVCVVSSPFVHHTILALLASLSFFSLIKAHRSQLIQLLLILSLLFFVVVLLCVHCVTLRE